MVKRLILGCGILLKRLLSGAAKVVILKLPFPINSNTVSQIDVCRTGPRPLDFVVKIPVVYTQIATAARERRA